MKAKGDFVGSHWASKGSYGKPIANCPGDGSGHMGGSKGSYIGSEMKSGRGPKNPTFVERNSPGKGSGPQSNRPAGGKRGSMSPRLGRMDMGNSD